MSKFEEMLKRPLPSTYKEATNESMDLTKTPTSDDKEDKTPLVYSGKAMESSPEDNPRAMDNGYGEYRDDYSNGDYEEGCNASEACGGKGCKSEGCSTDEACGSRGCKTTEEGCQSEGCATDEACGSRGCKSEGCNTDEACGSRGCKTEGCRTSEACGGKGCKSEGSNLIDGMPNPCVSNDEITTSDNFDVKPNTEPLTPDQEREVDTFMDTVATPLLIESVYSMEEIEEFVESVESDIAVGEGLLTERTIVKFDKNAKRAQLYETAVAAVARAKNDPLYKKLQTVYKLERILKAKLRKKYNAEANRKVKEWMARAKKSKSGFLSRIVSKITGK